jgi:hypothetical protein
MFLAFLARTEANLLTLCLEKLDLVFLLALAAIALTLGGFVIFQVAVANLLFAIIVLTLAILLVMLFLFTYLIRATHVEEASW